MLFSLITTVFTVTNVTTATTVTTVTTDTTIIVKYQMLRLYSSKSNFSQNLLTNQPTNRRTTILQELLGAAKTIFILLTFLMYFVGSRLK